MPGGRRGEEGEGGGGGGTPVLCHKSHCVLVVVFVMPMSGRLIKFKSPKGQAHSNQ